MKSNLDSDAGCCSHLKHLHYVIIPPSVVAFIGGSRICQSKHRMHIVFLSTGDYEETM